MFVQVHTCQCACTTEELVLMENSRLRVLLYAAVLSVMSLFSTAAASGAPNHFAPSQRRVCSTFQSHVLHELKATSKYDNNSLLRGESSYNMTCDNEDDSQLGERERMGLWFICVSRAFEKGHNETAGPGRAADSLSVRLPAATNRPATNRLYDDLRRGSPEREGRVKCAPQARDPPGRM